MSPRLSREPLSGADWFAVEFDPAERDVVMLDQRLLPSEVHYHRFRKPDEVATAIRSMVVRGAPAIGIAAAYALALVARDEDGDAKMFLIANGMAGRLLNGTRPTAVNLAWAIARMSRKAGEVAEMPQEERFQGMLAEAEAIHRDDVAACRRMGALGAEDVPDGAVILTHCNAGALATGGDGTALSVIFELARRGRKPHVWVDETRPLLQGARLTAWELMQRNIDCTLITDSMAAHVMHSGRVQAVVTGADRIAANGDAANKIGTYGVAVLAEKHDVPFYIAAPTSTFDMSLDSGELIPIEERAGEEITHGFGSATAPDGVDVYNPAFDVTPAELIAALVTERGVIAPVNRATIAKVVEG